MEALVLKLLHSSICLTKDRALKDTKNASLQHVPSLLNSFHAWPYIKSKLTQSLVRNPLRYRIASRERRVNDQPLPSAQSSLSLYSPFSPVRPAITSLANDTRFASPPPSPSSERPSCQTVTQTGPGKASGIQGILWSWP